jgi:hypothetical protein
MKVLDYIVVGSGPAGAIAAKVLVDAGKETTMINVGLTPNAQSQVPAGKSLVDLRMHDSTQYKWTVGKQGQGIAFGDVAGGAQITPPRQYMVDEVQEFMPLTSKSFFPIQSLGYGGLGIGWGIQCFEYSDADLTDVGLDAEKIKDAYDKVSGIIGISAEQDSASQYTIGSLTNYQPSATVDRNHKLLLKNYSRHVKHLNKKGIRVGRTPLALITKDKDGRKGYRYLETDFYSDTDKSAWRPWILIDALKKQKNFHYVDGILVTSFSEKNGITTVQAINTKTRKTETFYCKKLILAAGTLSTARIVMRSQVGIGARTPVLSNPHSYAPVIQPRLFGKGYEKKKLGFGQLSYFIDEDGTDKGVSVASSYGYQALMLFRIISQIPFNFADARLLSRFVLPGLIVMILQHPDYPSKQKYLELVKEPTSVTGDKIEAHFDLSTKDEQEWENREKKLMSMMRGLGAFPIKRLQTEHGSGIHYGGTLPFSDKPKKLHLSPSGRLHDTKNIFVVDSSGFKYLPGKGLTFTIMANAYVVAQAISKEEL